jgi:ferritin-like metal-binding protein YciE
MMAKEFSSQDLDNNTQEINTTFPQNNDQQTPADKYKLTDLAQEGALSVDHEHGVFKFFIDSIKDMYWAENHLVQTLPKIGAAASLNKLRQVILDHLEQTKQHAQRLEQVFEILGKQPEGRPCDAIEGLTKEGEHVIETTEEGSPARDLGIILASQKVEHYEISSYTGLLKLAADLGHPEIAEIFSQTLKEEVQADDLLEDIADNEVVALIDQEKETEQVVVKKENTTGNPGPEDDIQ